VERLQKYTGKLPVVRFGSTETCLQVCGTPISLSEEQRLAAFQVRKRPFLRRFMLNRLILPRQARDKRT
jgi:hypothetical protein